MSSSTAIVRCLRRRTVQRLTRTISSTTPVSQSVIKATNVGLTRVSVEREATPLFAGLANAVSNHTTTLKNEKENDAVVTFTEEGSLQVDMEALMELASRKPTPLRLQDMYKYATLGNLDQRLRNAQFLHKELPIRVAQRAVDLLTMPHGLSDSAPIREVAHIYLSYLKQLQDFQTPVTREHESAFTDMLQSLVLNRTTIPMAVARGIMAWHEEENMREDLDPIHLQEMEDGLYRFFTARVGLRFLVQHHVLSSPQHTSSTSLRNARFRPNDFLGCIQTECNPVAEIQGVAAEISRQTKAHYNGICPEIVIENPCSSTTSFTYVPHHLQYMVAELLKNSCRATVQRYLQGQNETIHPIRVVVVKGEEDVCIKIADRGGGVPRSTMDQIFQFAHSTADAATEGETEFGTDELTGCRVRGFGLPLARIYARYFGGELSLKSVEGIGLDAYLYLPRLGDACENLPESVVMSPGEQDSTPSSSSPIHTQQSAQTRRSFHTRAQPQSSNDRTLVTIRQTREGSMEQQTRKVMDVLYQRAL